MALTVGFTFLLALYSCFKLDNNLYNPNANEISEYRLNDYTGEVEITVGDEYNIPVDNTHLFTLDNDGKAIYALYVGNLNTIESDTVILYCHGNKDHLDFYWPRIKLLANTGHKNRYGILSIDYQGYGLSEGTPSEENLYSDVATALNWLKDKGVSNDRLVLYGFSLGSAPAVYHSYGGSTISSPLTASKLILESPFASADVLVQDGAVIAMPKEFLTDLSINNAERIKDVSQPLLLFHGVSDDFLAMKTHGELVYKNHTGDKKALRIPDAKHDDVPFVMGYDDYLKEIHDFIVKKP